MLQMFRNTSCLLPLARGSLWLRRTNLESKVFSVWMKFRLLCINGQHVFNDMQVTACETAVYRDGSPVRDTMILLMWAVCSCGCLWAAGLFIWYWTTRVPLWCSVCLRGWGKCVGPLPSRSDTTEPNHWRHRTEPLTRPCLSGTNSWLGSCCIWVCLFLCGKSVRGSGAYCELREPVGSSGQVRENRFYFF